MLRRRKMTHQYKTVSFPSLPEVLEARALLLLTDTQDKWNRIFKILPDSFCTMSNQYKTITICTQALNYKLSLFKHIPILHRTPNLCWQAITQNIELMYIISTKQKTSAMCNYAAQCRPEMILYEGGVPLTFRLPWMYEKLVNVNSSYIGDVPEVYISPKIISHLNKNKQRSSLIIRLRNTHIKINKEIKQDLLVGAWAPYRVRDWCLDTDTQKRLDISFCK